MEKAKQKEEYKKKWRVTERKKKRLNTFVAEYVRIKFGNVYNEAANFFKALTNIHPQKLDVRKTKEFKEWKKAIMNTENVESHIIVQTLSCGETRQETDQNDQYRDNEIVNNEETDKNDQHSNNEMASDKETDQHSNNEMASDEETEQNHQDTGFTDNMLLEIPLERYVPQHNKSPEGPSNNQYDNLPFSDERLRKIMDELREDPEFRAIFRDQENDYNNEDEGVELPTLEEEIHLDFEPFDCRLEVELAEVEIPYWENQM